MRLIEFGEEHSRPIGQYGSSFRMSRLLRTEQLHVGCMYIPAGGLVGMHPAAAAQLFAVVQGEGWVRDGQSERVPIRAGEAVLWSPGEQHESGTDRGMTVIVVEGEGL